MKALVSIIMGSTSDMPVMKKAAAFLNEMEIPFEINANPFEINTIPAGINIINCFGNQ